MNEVQKEKLKEILEIIRTLLTNEKIDLDQMFKKFIGSREELWKYVLIVKILYLKQQVQ